MNDDYLKICFEMTCYTPKDDIAIDIQMNSASITISKICNIGMGPMNGQRMQWKNC